MNFLKAFNALNVVAQTPATRLWLLANDPQALKQVEDAIRPVPGDDAVSVATSLLAERVANISANFNTVPAIGIAAAICNARGHVDCQMRTLAEANAFCAFAKVFLHPSATVQEVGPVNARKVFVVFHIDEDNA